MRSYVVFVLLVALIGFFVVLQVTGEPVPHKVSVADQAEPERAKGKEPKAKATAKTAADRPVPKTKTKTKTKTPAETHEAKAKPADKKSAKPAEPLMKRPLRVASLGWELISPGIVANDGAKPGKESLFSKERLPIDLKAFRTMEEVEAALARGGADSLGADVAIVPLPTFVASFEKLRALAPRIFFIVGWSRGQHGLMALPNVSLQRPPRGRVNLVGQAGEPATFLALFVLELAGVPPSRVRLLKPDDKAAKKAPFAAMIRPLPSGASANDRKFLVTSADATHLIPMVAIAPEGLLKSHAKALTVWGQVWLAGVEKLQQDVPGAARRVAALEQAPHALDLLKRLGQIVPAPLLDNARLSRLSGRSAVTLELLFQRCWRTWRAVGVISSPIPEVPPIAVSVMAAMVRTYPALVEAEPPRPNKPTTARAGDKPEEVRRLLTYQPRIRRIDQREMVSEVGFLAGIFQRSELKVSIRKDLKRSKSLVEDVRSRFDLKRPGRIGAAWRKAGRLVAVEIMVQQ